MNIHIHNQHHNLHLRTRATNAQAETEYRYLLIGSNGQSRVVKACKYGYSSALPPSASCQLLKPSSS